MKSLALPILLAGLSLAACAPDSGADQATEPAAGSPAADSADLARAIFAGGCFWCMEPPFDELEGVVSSTSGYIDGHVENPTYRQVSAGVTGHTEAVEIVFDPEKIGYRELLWVFWRNIDPLAVNRQFCDGGTQYRTGIYTRGEEQARLAQESLDELVRSRRFDQPIATEIEPAGVFYPAEDYHQDYYRKNPVRYKMYRTGCGRDRQLHDLWGDEAGH